MDTNELCSTDVAAICGDLRAARDALTEAIDLFERLGVPHELAEAREELARLGPVTSDQ